MINNTIINFIKKHKKISLIITVLLFLIIGILFYLSWKITSGILSLFGIFAAKKILKEKKNIVKILKDGKIKRDKINENINKIDDDIKKIDIKLGETNEKNNNSDANIIDRVTKHNRSK